MGTEVGIHSAVKYMFMLIFIVVLVIQTSHYILLRSLPGKIQFLYRTSLMFYKYYQFLYVLAWLIFLLRFDYSYRVSASLFVLLIISSLYMFWAAITVKHMPRVTSKVLMLGLAHSALTAFVVYLFLDEDKPNQIQQSFSMLSTVLPIAGIVITVLRRKTQWRRGEYVLVSSLMLILLSNFIAVWMRVNYDDVIFFYFGLVFLSIIYSTIPFVGYISSVITKKFEVVIHEATTDFLTQSRNRRFLEMYTERFSDRLSKSSIIVLDIDNFKIINDTYGHDTGDEVLRHISKVCSQIVREPDFLVRLGGEEFLILCGSTTISEAEIIAQRLCTTLADLPVELTDEQLTLTASFGVSAYDTKLSLKQNIARADNALYQAKIRGKNQVCIAEITSII